MIDPDVCREASELMAKLTPRERDVIVLFGKGLTMKEVADALGCCPSTVNDHSKAAHKKLDVHTRVEAVVIATKAGMV